MFRPSDVRRVQAAFDTDLIPPYEAEVLLSPDRLELHVRIADPDDAGLPVAQATWHFDERSISEKQPAEREIGTIVASMMIACFEYPAKKAADAAELAERLARQAANLAARQADAAAAEAQPEA